MGEVFGLVAGEHEAQSLKPVDGLWMAGILPVEGSILRTALMENESAENWNDISRF